MATENNSNSENTTQTKVSKNDITGDVIQTKLASDTYRQNWEKIFGNKKKKKNERRRNSTKV